MKYNIFIADDEDIIRKGIASFVQQDPDLNIIGDAQNGLIAYELIKKTNPDIVFLDINMPGMNGTEILEELKKQSITPLAIIISGYNDFCYLQKSIQLNVFDYILKPIKESTFFETLERAKIALVQKNEKADYMNWAKEEISRNKPQIISEFFKDILTNKLSEQQIIEKIRFYEIPLTGDYYLLLCRKKQIDLYLATEDWPKELLSFSITNVLTELFERIVLSTFLSNDIFVALISINNELDFQVKYEQLVNFLNTDLNLNITVSYTRCESVLSLHNCYTELLSRPQETTYANKKINEVLQYVHQHYREPDLSLDQLAKELFLSKGHISRIFRQEKGVSFITYLTNLRNNKAIELMKFSNLKMYEISDFIGYTSQHYFSKIFKKHTGMSPADYKKQIGAQKNE